MSHFVSLVYKRKLPADKPFRLRNSSRSLCPTFLWEKAFAGGFPSRFDLTILFVLISSLIPFSRTVMLFKIKGLRREQQSWEVPWTFRQKEWWQQKALDKKRTSSLLLTTFTGTCCLATVYDSHRLSHCFQNESRSILSGKKSFPQGNRNDRFVDIKVWREQKR